MSRNDFVYWVYTIALIAFGAVVALVILSKFGRILGLWLGW